MKKIRSPAKTLLRGGDWPRHALHSALQVPGAWHPSRVDGQRNVFLSFENSFGTAGRGALAQSPFVLGVWPEVNRGGFVLLEPPSASSLS